MQRGRLFISATGALVAVSTTVGVAQIGIESGIRIPRAPRTLKDGRDHDVVKQRFDYSCGAAALATLLRHGLGAAVTERDVMDDLFRLLSDDERLIVGRSGFSLLHLQRVAQRRGYDADGFRLSPAQLTMLDGPVIVFIEPRGYKHFAVLRGVRGDRVYLADPSRGNIRMPLYRFLDDWVQDDGRGVIFVVEPRTGLPSAPSPLALRPGPVSPPEHMTVRELLGVSAPPPGAAAPGTP